MVGRIGRPHGVRGEVTVEVRTDDPDLRFVPGAAMRTEPAERGPLTVAGARWHRDVLLPRLPTGVDGPRGGRGAARHRAGGAGRPSCPPLEDPDEFYDHQLVGLAARLPDGAPLGEVTAVRHEGNSLLVVAPPDGAELLVPFVSAIVPTVDVAGGFVVVDPPEGLLEL